MSKVIIFATINILSVYSASEVLGNWILGQATYHDFAGSTTACERPFDNDPLPTSTFPYDRYAAVSESLLLATKEGCGKCYEIKCLSDWLKNPDCNCEGSSIIVEAIDKSGDQVPPHFDLNPSTFQEISTPLCGRLNITYRQVSCDYQTGIKITNMDDNLWYYQFRIDAVAGYGMVNKIEVKSKGSNTWNECTRSLGKWFCNKGVLPYTFPLSMRFTQNGATNVVTATDVANPNTVGAVYWTTDNFILNGNAVTNSPDKAVTPSPVTSNGNGNSNGPVTPPYLVTYIGNTVRTSDAEKLASWAVPGYAPDNDYNIVNFAFWTSPSFGGVGRGTNGFTWGCDGWETIGTYLSLSTRVTLTGKSNPTDDEVREAIVQRFHNAGKKLLVAIFGATDHPIKMGENAATLGTIIGNIVKQFKLDGVDIDNEETDYLKVNGVGATWLCDLTNAIRAVLPQSEGYIISHAPQAPYFGTAFDYVRLHQLCGNNIDFYNVQYYNQGNEQYNNYQYIFQQTQSWATGSNVYAYFNTIGAEKIVIGKCTKNGGCGAASFEMTGQTIHGILQTAINNVNYPWSTGFMAWEFSGERNNNFELIKAVSPLFPQTPTAPTSQAPTKVTPAPVTKPPVPPTSAPPIGVGGGPGCKSNKICITLGGAATWWVSIYDPTNLSSGCTINDCDQIEVRVGGSSAWSIGYYDQGANRCAFDLSTQLSSTVSIDIKLTNNLAQTMISTNVIQSNAANSKWDFNANFDSCDAVNTNSPVKSPTKSPVKTVTNSPIKSPTKSPAKSPTKSPAKSPTKSPEKSPTKSPEKSPTKSPVKSPTKSPEKSPTKSPVKGVTNSPVKSPTKSPVNGNTNSPVKSPTNSPVKSVTNSPVKSPTKSPVISVTNSPVKSPTKSPVISNSNCDTKIPFKLYYSGPTYFAFEKTTTFNAITNNGCPQPKCGNFKAAPVNQNIRFACQEQNNNYCFCQFDGQISNQLQMQITSGTETVYGILDINNDFTLTRIVTLNDNFDTCGCGGNTNTNNPTNKPKKPTNQVTNSPTKRSQVTKNPTITKVVTKNPTITNVVTKNPTVTNVVTLSPTSAGEPKEDIKIKLWYGCGDWYMAFLANFEDTIPDECSVKSVHLKQTGTGTSQWKLCGLSGDKYACSGRFATDSTISIDVKITVQNGFYLTGYGIIKGYVLDSIYDFGTNFIGTQCTGVFTDDALTNAKVSAFDFSSYTAKSWGVFFSILIVLLLILFGIGYLIYHSISKKKKSSKDVEMQNMMHSTIQISERSPNYNNVPTPGGETLGGETQGNIQSVNESDSESPDGNNVNNVTMVTNE